MSDEQKPGDPADRAADGAFGGVQSHRAGYGDDKLARLTEWLRAHPTATLASGEGALLLAENDRLRDDLQKQADWADWAKGEIDRQRRILDALRESSDGVQKAAMWEYWSIIGGRHIWSRTIRAAVAAAEQEVGP